MTDDEATGAAPGGVGQPGPPAAGAPPAPDASDPGPAADSEPLRAQPISAFAAESPPSADPPAGAASYPPGVTRQPGAPGNGAEPAAAPRRTRGAHAAAPSGLLARYGERRKKKRAAKTARPRRKAPWWELPALVVLAIAIAILVKTFIIQPFYIPSESMEKTLHGCAGCHGDRILVNKVIYDFRDPHPGDIVVFHAPPGWDDEPISRPPSNPVLRVIRGFGQLIGFVPPDGQVLVKRVIAVGGQTVEGDSHGHVKVSNHGTNGPFRTLEEPYVFIDAGQRDSVRPFGPVTVPKGRLWVMGDHRNDSADSRYHCGTGGSDTPSDTACNPVPSTVPVSEVIGKAFVIAWPPSRWRTLGTPPTFEAGFVLPIVALRSRRRRRAARGGSLGSS